MNVIIDTDPGVDDSMAILLALASPELNVLGLTICHGNLGDMDRLAKNARIILELAGKPDIPVYIGEKKAMHFEHSKGAPFVHGNNGLGDVEFGEPKKLYNKDKTAIEFIIETCEQYKNNISLIALAPLTNVGKALTQKPELASWVDHVYLMGGTFGHPGNISPSAEANIFNDPHAAQIVFSADWEITAAPLNVTHTVGFGQEFLKKLKETSVAGKFIHDVAQFYLGFYNSTGREHMCFHDPTTIMSIIRPELFTLSMKEWVYVECDSAALRGTTLTELRRFNVHDPSTLMPPRPQPHTPPHTKQNCTILLAADADAILDEFVKRIASYPAQ